MSKTGTYATDKKTGKLVKISDKIPKLRSHVYYPPRSQQRCGAYFDENLGDVIVRDKEHKRRIMKEQHLAEAG